jgi:hypothetical protein
VAAAAAGGKKTAETEVGTSAAGAMSGKCAAAQVLVVVGAMPGEACAAKQSLSKGSTIFFFLHFILL